MNEEERLFGGFALLEPSSEQSAEAVRKTRAAILSNELALRSSEIILQPRRRIRTAVAATVLLTVCAVWLSLPHSDRLLAQVVRQVASAESVRVVTETMEPDGKWNIKRVTTLAREFGFLEQHFLDGELIQSDIDNGTHHWAAPVAHQVVTQSESVEFAWLLDRILNPLNSHRTLKRHSSGDQVIDGISHACYRSNTGDQRMSIWIDRQGRARSVFIEQPASDGWQPVERINVTYGIEIESSVFQSPSGDGVSVVDVSELLNEMFSLDDAVHREQKLGYEFAIHNVKRINDVEYYFLMSFRPTAATLTKLNLRPGESPGDVSPAFRTKPGRILATQETEEAHYLAIANGGEMRVLALLCRFQGLENERVERAQPAFKLFAHPKIWGEVDSISEVSFQFAIPDEETPIEEIVRSVYDTFALLEPLTIEQLNLVDRQDGTLCLVPRCDLPRRPRRFTRDVAACRRGPPVTVRLFILYRCILCRAFGHCRSLAGRSKAGRFVAANHAVLYRATTTVNSTV